VPALTEPGVYPSFDQAVQQFAEFARGNELPATLAFVTPRDVVIRAGAYVVHIPEQTRARGAAANAYAAAVRRDLGVLLGGLCVLHEQTCVFVASPADVDEASRLMYPRGLKLSLPAQPRPAQLGSWPAWPILSLLESRTARERKAWLFR
jgi:hypothetical protein